MGQSWPHFDYIWPFLTPISILISTIQIEKTLMVCRGFKPGAAGWQVQTKPQSYGGHRYVREHFIFMLDVTRRIIVFPIDDTFKDIGYYDNIIKMGHSRRLVLLFAIFFQTMQCIVFVILRKTNFGTEVALRHGGQFRYKVFEPCNDIPFRHVPLGT